MEHEVITLAHGAGGQLSHALMEEVVLPELLLPADLTPRDLADRVLAYHERAKDPAFRQQVREHALASYNADANYPAFVRYIGELAEQDG